MKIWKKLTTTEINHRITGALKENTNFKTVKSLGIPASHLDGEVFYDNAPFLEYAPLLRTFVQNPNHIGCHTLGESEAFFAGTQALEREAIELLAKDVLKGDEDEHFDGYIASGGTEANLQAIWIYRNYFKRIYKAEHHEIAIISSADSHYSMPKSGNILNIDWIEVPVEFNTRDIIVDKLNEVVENSKSNGKKYFIVVSNMATTMFGSVDNPNIYVDVMNKHNLKFKMHVDAAFGGFIYPISNTESKVNFLNEHISSITLDAHKMLQAPYGTGVFIARKGLMKYVFTEEAEYVSGMDITVSGSRSGANALSVWMILFTYGPYGWLEKINKLLYRTSWLCSKLDELGVQYFRDPHMNLVTMHAEYIPKVLVTKYGLVPQTHTGDNKWYKIVVMDHVELDDLNMFIKDLSNSF
ncbi:MAG: aspartate aminotransferase family protein [Ichthyobacteriaceae bacterium]|nr:aspartate aminotransferase family protein [Ichthyobacteriaceae bacterium]